MTYRERFRSDSAALVMWLRQQKLDDAVAEETRRQAAIEAAFDQGSVLDAEIPADPATQVAA